MHQNEGKLSTLWVVENTSPAVLRWPLSKRIAQALLRRKLEGLRPRLGAADWVLGPQMGERDFPGGRFISWDSLRLMAKSSHEEPEALLEFARAAVEILEKENLSWRNGISVPSAMMYAFLSPFSEDLPFSISGLKVFIGEKSFRQVAVFGSGYWACLAAEAAASSGLQVQKLSGTGISALNKLLAALAGLKARVFRRSPDPGLSAPGKGAALVCVGKERSLRYANPLLAALDRAPPAAAIGFARPAGEHWPGVRMLADFFPPSETKRELARMVRECDAVWKKCAEKIRALPHRYHGVPIASFHWEEMARLWNRRAPATAFCAEKGDAFLSSISPRAVVMQEPLELSRVISELARKRGIFRLFHYSIYDSYPLTAGLWEGCMQGIADHYGTMNAWQRERLLSKRHAPPEAVSVVGDILQLPPESEATRAALRLSLLNAAGLPANRPLLTVLSRGTISTFTRAEKERMMKAAFTAAGENGFSILIKGHPYESREVLESELAAWGCSGAKVVIQELRLHAVVSASDLVIGPLASSSNLDVIYARTPLVLTGREELFQRFDAEDGRYAYRRYRAGLCVTEEQNLMEEVSRVMKSHEERQKLVREATQFAEKISGPQDGKAAERLAALLPTGPLDLRPALPEDSRDLWAWRNDPDTRAMSVNPGEVAWDSHQAWFAKALANPLIFFYIGSLPGGEKIGMCRFDLQKDGSFADVSINLNPELRGRKLSQPMLAYSVEAFLRAHPVPLKAVVKKTNEASNKVFLRCGFRAAGQDEVFNHYIHESFR